MARPISQTPNIKVRIKGIIRAASTVTLPRRAAEKVTGTFCAKRCLSPFPRRAWTDARRREESLS